MGNIFLSTIVANLLEEKQLVVKSVSIHQNDKYCKNTILAAS